MKRGSLYEITRSDVLLRDGFIRRDEETTDNVRSVWYEKRFDDPDGLRLTLQVEFELAISDNPRVRTQDNFAYFFNGVFLRVSQKREDTGEDGEPKFFRIGRTGLRVSTRAELRSLCRMLGETVRPVAARAPVLGDPARVR